MFVYESLMYLNRDDVSRVLLYKLCECVLVVGRDICTGILPEGFAWGTYLRNLPETYTCYRYLVCLPEERMLVSPHVGEQEPADVGESRYLGRLVLCVVRPHESNKPFHNVEVSSICGDSRARQKEVNLRPALKAFA